MKLWQKVFICTFLLFEFFFNASIIYFIEYNFKGNLKKEIDRGLSDHAVISSGLKTNEILIKTGGYYQDIIKNYFNIIMQYYGYDLDSKGTFVEMTDLDNRPVYISSKLNYTGSREELSSTLSDKRVFIIRDIGQDTYLFVSNLISFAGFDFKFSYIRDISFVYRDRADQYNLFFKLNAIVSICLFWGLYVLIQYFMRPVKYLTKSAKTMADGNYQKRVEIMSGDEIGVLSSAFNKMAEAVENNINALERYAKSKEIFIEYLTHELKTPLTSIIGYADFLITTKCDEEFYIKSLKYIYTEGKRLESLSFKLMDLIFLEKGNFELKSEDISLICKEAEESMKHIMDDKNILLILDVPSCRLMIERDLFKILITNLLDNAMKASKNGDSIYLSGNIIQNGQFTLEIRDQGFGIPEEDVPKVFEPFFMVNKARSRAQNGAGLGLAICQMIINLHNGKIDIKSRVSEGTSIQITLPCI